MNLVTPKAGVKHELLFNKLASALDLMYVCVQQSVVYMTVINSLFVNMSMDIDFRNSSKTFCSNIFSNRMFEILLF